MSSVDRRLQNIQDELRSERQQLRKRQDEVGKISTELKQVGRDEVGQIYTELNKVDQDEVGKISTEFKQVGRDEVGKISIELKEVGRDEVDQISGTRDTGCLKLHVFHSHIGT